MIISCTDRVRSEEILNEGVEYCIQGIEKKAEWIGHILRRNCLLKHVTKGKEEGRIKVTG
jgi:hypothetical protein